MIVTPYGDIYYGDAQGMRLWMQSHDQRHRAYSVALLRQGIVSQSPPLADQLNADWLMRHYIQHAILAKQLSPDSTAQSHGLSHDPNESERSFYNWMLTHNRVHTRLDQALGLIGHG